MFGEIATPIIIALAASSAFLAIYVGGYVKRSWGFDIIQPPCIFAAFHVAYVLIPALYIWLQLDYVPNWARHFRDPESFNVAVLLQTAGLMCFTGGYWMVRQKPFSSRPVRAFPQVSNSLLYCVFVVGLLIKVAVLLQMGGVDLAIQRMSPSIRSEIIGDDRMPVVAAALLSISYLADGIFLYLALRVISLRGSIWVVLLTLIPLASLNYLILSKRSVVVILIFYVVVYWHYLRGRLNAVACTILVAFLTIVLVGGLVARVVLPQISYGMAQSAGEVIAMQDGILSFYLNSPELAVTDMVILAVQEREEVLQDFGGHVVGLAYYNFAPLGFVVPRLIWPGKPEFEDISHVMFRLSTGRDISVGFALGLVGYWYVIAGPVGVLVICLTLGIAVRWIVSQIDPWCGDPFRVYFYAFFLWMFFQYIRFGTFGFTFLLIVQTGLVPFVLVLGLNYLRGRGPVRLSNAVLR